MQLTAAEVVHLRQQQHHMQGHSGGAPQRRARGSDCVRLMRPAFVIAINDAVIAFGVAIYCTVLMPWAAGSESNFSKKSLFSRSNRPTLTEISSRFQKNDRKKVHTIPKGFIFLIEISGAMTIQFFKIV
jgi:hypothetical protein